MGTGKKSTSAPGKARGKICSYVCCGPEKSKGIWEGVGRAGSAQGLMPAAPHPRCLLRTLFLRQSCPSSATHLEPVWDSPVPSSWACWPSEPTPWMVAPASRGQPCCCGTAALLEGPSHTIAALPESKEGAKDPQSCGQLRVLMLLSEIWPAEAAVVLPLHQKCHSGR